MRFFRSCYARFYHAWQRRRRLSLRGSITVRLALGFFLAALLAAAATGVIGLQQLARLRSQATFYQALLQTNTTLTTGSDFLKSIETESTTMRDDARSAHVDAEMLSADEQGLQALMQQYNSLLLAYTTHDLLLQHPEEVGVLDQGNSQLETAQQHTYAAGVLRSWYLYQGIQQQILQNVQAQRFANAQTLARLQGEPDYADALGALHSLIQFNEQLANLVDGATSRQAQLLTALVGALLVFLAVLLIGLTISRSLIRRLKSLHRVTQAVKQGGIDARVVVKGVDEIAEVSHSVNAMLDALVTALEQATTAREQTNLAYMQQRQLNEMKDDFIRHVSHELRTPLTEVYGFLQLLRDHQEHLDTEQLRYFLTQAIKGCEELITMCTAILDTSRQTAIMRSPQHLSIPLAEVVKDLLAQWNPQDKAEHPVHLKIPTTLEVFADPQYLRQVLRNLLSNAFKYTPANGSIFCEALPPEQVPGAKDGQAQAGIRIRDTGPGIPPEEQGLLFQPFARLKRDLAGTIRGTGLGLYLCRRFIEAMSGRIWVESSGIAGEGSSFCLTLPQAYPSAEAPSSVSNDECNASCTESVQAAIR